MINPSKLKAEREGVFAHCSVIDFIKLLSFVCKVLKLQYRTYFRLPPFFPPSESNKVSSGNVFCHYGESLVKGYVWGYGWQIQQQKSPLLKVGYICFSGGERGIRTLGGAFTPHSLSRRAPSADSAISPQRATNRG